MHNIHTRTHARTHARTHTHTYVFMCTYIYHACPQGVGGFFMRLLCLLHFPEIPKSPTDCVRSNPPFHSHEDVDTYVHRHIRACTHACMHERARACARAYVRAYVMLQDYLAKAVMTIICILLLLQSVDSGTCL